jgi:hypothetical protein
MIGEVVREVRVIDNIDTIEIPSGWLSTIQVEA